jgi:hypothetical protein
VFGFFRVGLLPVGALPGRDPRAAPWPVTRSRKHQKIVGFFFLNQLTGSVIMIILFRRLDVLCVSKQLEGTKIEETHANP